MLDSTQLLVNSLKSHYFVKRGSAMFRVHGEGILQVVKFERERDGRQNLNIGLFSLYSELLPQWFSSRGCIPRYPVMNIIGERGQGLMMSRQQQKYYPNSQIEILLDNGIAWLDSINTQKKMMDGLLFLETNWGGNVIWVDDLKIAPCLYCGDYNTAEVVITAILNQHRMAYKANRQIFTTQEAYQRYLEPRQKEDEKYTTLLEWIHRKDGLCITDYLQKNYDQNLQYAKFCIHEK